MLTLPELLLKMEEMKSYDINSQDNQVLTREQVGEMLSTHFEDAISAINDGSLLRAISACDQEISEKLLSYQHDLLPAEEILFYLQYDLNHDLPFSYRECIYRDIKSLGEQILNGKAEQEVIMEALRRKLFHHYFKIKTLDTSNPDIYEGILVCEQLIHQEDIIAYYALGYYLSERNYYLYRNHKMKSIIDLYHYLSRHNLFNVFSLAMEHDWLFFGWLYYHGKQDIVAKWRISLKAFEEEEANELTDTKKGWR